MADLLPAFRDLTAGTRYLVGPPDPASPAASTSSWVTSPACTDVVIWVIDLKRGMELGPWAACLGRLATTPAEARALLADAVAILEARAEHLAVTGQRVWEPSPDWPTQRAMGQGALRSQMDAQIDKGEWADPSKQPTGDYLDEWAAGLRLGASTMASYRKNIRLHLKPYLGAVPLRSLTTVRIDALYRQLEARGRRDHKGELTGGPLSARTVRYAHTILSAALADAAEAGRLARNPAAAAHPPTAKQAKAPEMRAWTAAQLAAFLGWAGGDGHAHAPAWHVLAHTGMRRGEALALRWRNVGLDAGTVSVRRSAGMVRVAGESAEVTEGDTKSGKPRVVDLDPLTVAVLRSHRKARGSMALQLARDDALVFADHEGRHLQPEHFSRSFADALRRCAKRLAAAAPPAIRLHDLRHTHATVLLTAGVPVHVVSQRLGHTSAVITLQVYAHVVPGSQRDAADLFARIVAGAAS